MPDPAPPKAVVFDLDGTLVDSREDIARACNFTLETMGRPPLDEATVAGFVGDGARVLLGRALGEEPKSPVVDRALSIFRPFYAAHSADSTRWMPGAREVLDALGHRPAALVTNKPRAATLPLLARLGASDRFASIVTGDDGPLKPDPAAIRAALDPLGVRPEDAWMVGDGVQDVEAGRAAGCTTIAVRGGFASDERLRAARPDVLLDSLDELRKLLARA